MITLSHTKDFDLPNSVRSYIDSCAQEFHEVDTWTKIAQLAYRIKRGADLLPDFIYDIKRHIEHPAYGSYEEIAKTSIANYIDQLRINRTYDIAATVLPNKMSFAALFQLFTEEILYRYWEQETDFNTVECHFDKVLYDSDEIAKRYDEMDSKTANREFTKYISTSRETLCNIEVDEYSIRKKNEWSLLAEELYGYTLWSDKEEDERIYPGDAPFLHSFNEKTDPRYQYVVGVPPMPFSGNILRAKVVMLTLNPGYIEDVNKTKCMALHAAEKEQLLCLMKRALHLDGCGIYDDYECSRIQGDYYWERALPNLALEAYDRPSTEKCHPIFEDVAFLQLIGYHSIKFKYAVGIKHLPFTIFLHLLVKYLATKTDKTFLVLRSEKLWEEIMGEELWNKLIVEGRIITKGHKGMAQAISRGKIKKNNGYDKLVNILKH